MGSAGGLAAVVVLVAALELLLGGEDDAPADRLPLLPPHALMPTMSSAADGTTHRCQIVVRNVRVLMICCTGNEASALGAG